jgi:predicted RNA binding protein YcfA (HicA-like mRNA interferase family)
MTGIPKITGKKVISTLGKAGFEVIRIKGSHHFRSRHSVMMNPIGVRE